MFSPVARSKQRLSISVLLLLQFFLIYSNSVEGQQYVKLPTTNKQPTTRFCTKGASDLFNANKCFIKNVGQYNDSNAAYKNMGQVRYGFEGFTMPVLFTDKGLVYLQGKLKNAPHKERHEREREKETVEEEMEKRKYIYRYLTMQWLNANPHPVIETQNELTAYHTYGLIQEKAKSFKKIIYKDVYPGIDIVYSFKENSSIGFEYSIIVKPGSDLNNVHLKYGGNVHSIKKDKSGGLVISSDIEGIKETVPISFYQQTKRLARLKEDSNLLNAHIQIARKENEIHFAGNYDHRRTLIIDPFVSSTSNLTGAKSGKAADIDFDFAGNIFVTGGGDKNIQKLAKFDANGVLQWTFSGTLGIWTFGQDRGGSVVEKPSGKIYLAQGATISGYQVIRLNSAGVYDNYISTANSKFQEGWKLYWTCNNGAPQLMIAGGGTNANNCFGILSPPGTSITALNITGLASYFQDIVDIVIDPVTNDLYTLFPTNVVSTTINMIYKNRFPYSINSVIWNVPTGFNSLFEARNRPYYAVIADNSANIIAINNSYLFYWDGQNLKAFDKVTGAGVGATITTANAALMQGGIIADACNNVFIGDANGMIKVYHFDGNNFDDAAEPDITIPGYTGKSVYDLAYDESKKLLYASGDGFVASFDISSYCASTQFALNINADCNTGSLTATVTPTPPAATTVNYSLYKGGIQIQNNATGVFTSIQTGITYKIIATLNQACSGMQVNKDFTLSAPTFDATQTTITNSTCGNNNGGLQVAATGSIAPYLYSIDGINYQATGVFNGLAPGNYTVITKDANGCTGQSSIIIAATNGPTLNFTTSSANCSPNSGTITATATGGTGQYFYSIDGVNYQTSNVFNNLAAGNYTLSTKDGNGCITTKAVSITTSTPPSLQIAKTDATCGNTNGIITATTTGGSGQYSYSIDGINYQPANVFNNLAAGNYTVITKDANGCTAQSSIAVTNTNGPTLTFSSSSTSCSPNSGTITATATGGTGQYSYSIDGVNYQAASFFNNLPLGNYTLSTKDANGCIATLTASITGSVPPTLQIAKTDPSCGSNNGTVTATALGGLAPYLFSIDNINWSAGNSFNNLLPGSYTVSVKDASGCSSNQSVQLLNGTSNINLHSGGDVSICLGTSTVLAASSNGTNFTWTPAIGLNNPAIQSPLASPTTTTKYYITASDGICSQQDSVTVTVYPAPIANAGPDITVCFEASTQLDGSGGGFFNWSPNTFLTNNKSSNPIVEKPTSTTTYNLTVVNGFGCQSFNKSSATIYVLPESKVFAGDDAVVYKSQSLQLHAKDISNSQFTTFVWSPSSGLDNYTSQNPIATPDKDITYELTAITKDGCTASDQVKIKVVEMPEIYVPSGFTPNGDGKDDFLKALPIGIKHFKYLSVYNRWGAIIFYTTDASRGWDGTINGVAQNTDTYIWIAEGTDYNGNSVVKKGTTVLIR